MGTSQFAGVWGGDDRKCGGNPLVTSKRLAQRGGLGDDNDRTRRPGG